MNPPETNGKRSWKRHVVRFSALGLAVAVIIVFFRTPTETVTFRIVDAETGKPLTDAVGIIYGRWTGIPIEKLQIGRLTPWKMTDVANVDGNFTVALPSHPKQSFISFYLRHDSYRSASITVVEGGFHVNRSGSASV